MVEWSKLIKKSAVSPYLVKVFIEFVSGNSVSPLIVTLKSIGSEEFIFIFLILNLVLFILENSISFEKTISKDFKVTPSFALSNR